MAKVSAVLIVINESMKLERCLRSLDWVDEIVVVDGGSKDQTMDIARRLNAKVYQRPFDDFANQKNYAIEKANGDWIFSIDADEIVTAELCHSIQNAVSAPDGCNGFYVTRTNLLFGKTFKYGGQGPEKVLRLFKKGYARFEQPIHEKLVVQGKVSELSGNLTHLSIISLVDYNRKFRLYTDFEACWLKQQGKRDSIWQIYFMPVLRFLYFYILRLGFLDGYEALLFHYLSSKYYFVKYMKLKELLLREA